MKRLMISMFLTVNLFLRNIPLAIAQFQEAGAQKLEVPVQAPDFTLGSWPYLTFISHDVHAGRRLSPYWLRFLLQLCASRDFPIGRVIAGAYDCNPTKAYRYRNYPKMVPEMLLDREFALSDCVE